MLINGCRVIFDGWTFDLDGNLYGPCRYELYGKWTAWRGVLSDSLAVYVKRRMMDNTLSTVDKLRLIDVLDRRHA